jgi:hypothetical protein
MIRECLESLPQGAVVAANREEVIASCVAPVMLLTEAVRLADKTHPLTEAVLIQCIRRLNAQAENAHRVTLFSNLLTKLSNHRKQHAAA